MRRSTWKRLESGGFALKLRLKPQAGGQHIDEMADQKPQRFF
jgi:hypothetical protein